MKERGAFFSLNLRRYTRNFRNSKQVKVLGEDSLEIQSAGTDSKYFRTQWILMHSIRPMTFQGIEFIFVSPFLAYWKFLG